MKMGTILLFSKREVKARFPECNEFLGITGETRWGYEVWHIPTGLKITGSFKYVAEAKAFCEAVAGFNWDFDDCADLDKALTRDQQLYCRGEYTRFPTFELYMKGDEE